MKRTLAIVTLAVIVLMTAGPAIAQQQKQTPVAPHGQRQAQTQGQHQNPPARAVYQRRDTWYEFLLEQFNPNNFDYGAWMEERRQVFLNESVRSPYFKYSAAVTIALLLLTLVCAKQSIDHRRSMWITAEMMVDLYNHDLYSRDVAEKTTQKYNDHIQRATEPSRRANMELQCRAPTQTMNHGRRNWSTLPRKETATCARGMPRKGSWTQTDLRSPSCLCEWKGCQ